jgi:uncharacterized protein with PIN domain
MFYLSDVFRLDLWVLSDKFVCIVCNKNLYNVDNEEVNTPPPQQV